MSGKPELALAKLGLSLKSAAKIFTRPWYVLLFLFGVLFASALILWSLNLGLVRYIVFEAPISVIDKLGFFADVYKGIYTSYNTFQGTGIIVFSLLFGINLALLVFILKNRGFKAVPKKSGVGGFALAVVGGGCVACGTSIIAPLVATFGATSTSFISELGGVLAWVGSLFIIYSIYKLGLICSILLAKSETNTLQ